LDKQRLLHKPNRTFPTVEEAVASRATRGISEAAARLLAERNLHESTEGLVWMTDPRLRGASAVKLTEGQIQSVLKALSMPTLLMLAAETPARYREVADWASRYIKHLTVQEIAGGHHFHMEAPAAEVAQRLREFLSQTQERECA
jgi:pimeloyl-ACP methyl ester carboxylesterase